MKSKHLLPRLMIINLDGEDPTQLVRRYLPVARAKLGFEVDAVWCSQVDLERLRKTLTGIKVIATSYCPAGYFQLGKWTKGGDTNADATSAEDPDQRPRVGRAG